MDGKITLITPPDIFENANKSILLINLSEEEQDSVSRWLASAELKEDVNLYVHSGEPNAIWFLYALNRCEYKYINLDNVNFITQALSSYALSRNNVYYKSTDENLVGIYSHINTKRIAQVQQFLESVLGAKTSDEQPQL